jgi:methionine biosynthesis protein MetW
MPVNKTLPYQWYDTPNIHFCTIKDFVVLCREMGVTIERSLSLDHGGHRRRIGSHVFFNNILGGQAVFVLSR